MVKSTLQLVTVLSLISLPVLAALKTGERAPDFSASASLAGKEFNFSLQDALKKGPVLVYFIHRPTPAAVILRLTPSPSRKTSSMPPERRS